jgi:two-component system cell cycle sensor histidine kinase/response regulator CckA
MGSLNGATGAGHGAHLPVLAPSCTRERGLGVEGRVQHEQRLQVLEELTASVAHGLNNLLGAVAVQSAELLDATPGEGEGEDEARRSGLRLIHQAALDATGLVQRLLRLSRGEPVDGAERPELVDLGRVLADAVELTRSRWHNETGERGRPIDPTVEAEQPLLVRGVASDLREIVVNLILNAVDAMPAGGRLLLRGVERDGAVILTCQDSGVGMAPDVLEQIFDPFFTTKGRHGTGMGLAIVQSVVARLGGEVRVTSAVGVGTTFTLLLPAAELTRGFLETEAARAATADDLAASLATLSVLVVEDDPIFRAVFTRRLGLDALRVDAVGDAASALAALETDCWDLLCIDDGLPDRPGRELAAEIRRRRPGCVIILVTGSATRPDDPNLAAPDVDAILPKPCTDAELARALRTARARQALAP